MFIASTVIVVIYWFVQIMFTTCCKQIEQSCKACSTDVAKHSGPCYKACSTNVAKHSDPCCEACSTNVAKHSDPCCKACSKKLQNIQARAAKHVQQMLQDIQTPQSNDAAMNAERHQKTNIKHARCQPSMFKTLQSIPHSPHPILGALQLPGALQHWLQVLCRTRTLQYLHRWSPCSPWNWFVPKTKLEACMGAKNDRSKQRQHFHAYSIYIYIYSPASSHEIIPCEPFETKFIKPTDASVSQKL